MVDVQILEKINSFDRWHYQFDLAGHKTPIFRTDMINRHEQRKNYFFRPLVELCGGSLAGKRVLDLGCNAGFWSLCAIESGCDYVLGIDGRKMHIDQAKFVFSVKGIDKGRYDFYYGNVFDLLTEGVGTFDIVLCLGLMYHINKPITLLERVSAANTDLLVIDTRLSRMRGATLEVCHESLDEPRHAVDYELVLTPTRAAVLDMVQLFGYRGIVLKPDFTDYTGAVSYKKGYRRAFICAKRTDLTALDAEDEPPENTVHSQDGTKHPDITEIPGRDLVRALVRKAIRRFGRAIARHRGR